MRRSLRSLALVAVIATAPRAHAGVAADALAHYEKGATLYNLGKFTEAIAEFQQAYVLDPDPVYLFNLAQAYRKAGELDQAAFALRRYLGDPRATEREPATRLLAEIDAEQKLAADKLAAGLQAAAELSGTQAELSGTQAELARARAELAAARHPEPGTIRVGLESGVTLAYIVGVHTRYVGLTTSLAVSKVIHRRNVVLDVGGMVAVLPIPYTDTSGVGRSVFCQQALATAAARVGFSEHWFGVGELGAGFGTYTGMYAGNPFGKDGMAVPNTGSLDAQLELAVGYRISPAVEAVYAVGGSASTRASAFRDQVSGVVTLTGIVLGLHVLL